MALYLQTEVEGEKFYSCYFPEISATSDQSYINLTLLIDGNTALSTRYYTVAGRIIVRNLASCIELAMEQRAKVYSTVKLTLTAGSDTVSATCQVLFCKTVCMGSSVEALLSNSFLTTQTHRITTLHGMELVNLYLEGSGNYANANFRYSCRVRLADGSITIYEYTSFRRIAYGITQAMVSASDVLSACQSHYGEGVQLLDYTLSVGSRTMHFYVIPCPSATIFAFRNVFGCQEYVAFPATTKAKLETDYSEAMVDGQLRHYDTRHQRTYEVQTPSQLSSQMEWLEQFLTSPKISVSIPKFGLQDVLIKEYEFEHTDAPGEENILSFTYQFASSRQTMHRQTFDTGIFSIQFSNHFA